MKISIKNEMRMAPKQAIALVRGMVLKSGRGTVWIRVGSGANFKINFTPARAI